MVTRTASPKSEFRAIAERDYDAMITIIDNAYPDFKLGAPGEREKYRASIVKLRADMAHAH